ncbi:MAG: TonB-dependent receptor [Bacteroidales bacterium]|nr:TonB-dependent receptor [Bacteroidales bacterium]
MFKQLTLVLCSAFILCDLQAAANISGIVTDRNGQSIPFVSVAVKGTTLGTISDDKGRFDLRVADVPVTLAFNCMGFTAVEQTVTSNTSKLRIQLDEESAQLDEVQVVGRYGRSRKDNVIIGVENIQMSEMAKVPALMGERDVIKSIQLLPGIKAEGDGSCGFQVRGGTSAQNLILIDHAPIYNAGHLMGVFSTFNDDALTNASLYKGAIPAQFGDAASSVFDIQTRSGDMDQYYCNASIGLLSSKIAIDGPIVRDKASFFVSARRTYFELFLKPTEKYRDKVLNFYDINAKVSVRPYSRGQVNVMFFRGRDNMDVGKHIAEIHWGNTATALDYRHSFGPRVSATTSLIYSKYDFTESMNVLKLKESFSGYMQHHTAREEIRITPGEQHSINLGAQYDHINLKSGEFSLSNGQVEKELRRGDELSYWAGDEWQVPCGLEVSAGVRGVLFKALDADCRKRYSTFEPRLSLKYRISDQQSIKAGYCRTSQYVQAILDNGMSSPIGRSVMSGRNIKPQVSDQVSAGYATEILDQKYELSVEAYYKKIDNVYDYRDGKNLVSDIEMEKLILRGEGRAYGVEFFAKRNAGRLTGWLSYTLSWAENKVEGINYGRWYTAANDRRHDISIVAMYQINRDWDLSATWLFTSGQALTAPSAKYDTDEYTHYYYAERNGYRAPAYHRLDVGVNNTKERRRYTRIWSLGIYNLYNHYNPYVIVFENDDEKASGTKTTQISLFGLIPSATLTIKF